MSLLSETYNIQEKLGTYCKTGKEVMIPGLTENRVHHYRRLVYNVVKNTMIQAFPLTHQVLKDDDFENLVHKFFSETDCQTPQIWKLPGEFYEWAVKKKISEELQLAWLNDLLLFEWIEIDVHTMEDITQPKYSRIKDIFTDYLVFNPEFKLIRLEYPVHLFKIEEAAQKKGMYFVMIGRHPESGNVYFFDLSVLHVWIIENLTNNAMRLVDLFPGIYEKFGIDSETILKQNLHTIFSDLIQKKMILGSRT